MNPFRRRKEHKLVLSWKPDGSIVANDGTWFGRWAPSCSCNHAIAYHPLGNCMVCDCARFKEET